MTNPLLDWNDAQQRDARDELAAFRQRFVQADAPRSSAPVSVDPDGYTLDSELPFIYLDGNSLGRLPLQTAQAVQHVIEQQWGQRLIRSWGEDWMAAPTRVGDALAGLLGAAPGQVLVGDSTSVNLFKLAMAALALRPARAIVLSDPFNFPSDLYILQGCLDLRTGDHHLRLVPSAARDDDALPDQAALLQAINHDTALVCLSQVVFKSGSLYDVAAITRRAHEAGALVLWDLSHSVGVVPIELDAWDVDFAVGCTYKYLNGGPGSPAILYVNQRLQDQAQSPIRGWFGRSQPFSFQLDYQPAAGVGRFQAGTPAILSLLALEAGLAILQEAGIERIRAKSVAQTSYLIDLFDDRLAALGFRLATPRDARLRGSHVTLRHPEGYRINRALIEEMNLLPDFREPDHLRLGIAPLYTRFSDLWQAVERIARVVTEKRYQHFSPERLPVT